MDFISDTETIIKLQTLNNTIENLYKTAHALLNEAKKLSQEQSEIVSKIDNINELNDLMENIGGYQRVATLMGQIQEINPFIKDIEYQIDNIETKLKDINNKAQDYLNIEQKLEDKFQFCQKHLEAIEVMIKLDQELKHMGGLQGFLAQIIEKENDLKIFSQEFEDNIVNNIQAKLTILNESNNDNLLARIKSIEKEIESLSAQNREINQEILENKKHIADLDQNLPLELIREETDDTENNEIELTWEMIIAKEPLVSTIKKYSETYRIEKLFTTNSGQLVYGIRRSTIRIIIIFQNNKARSIILRDDDKRKELNLNSKESEFVYKYIDYYVQSI